jgi:hypothetical protein
VAAQQIRQGNWRRRKPQGNTTISNTFTYYTCGQQGHASTNISWKEEIFKMIRKKTQNHKSTRGPNEKKNEKVTVNMVMVVTTRSKAPEEVAF